MRNILIIILVLAMLVATAYYAKGSLASMLPLLTAVIPAAVAYYLSRKKELELKISEEKRTRYEKLILHVKKGFFDPNITDAEKIKHKDEYYEQSYVVWLYASDEVVRGLNNFARAFAAFSTDPTPQNNETAQKSLGKVVVSMRKDIQGATDLSSDEFITTTVTRTQV